MILNELQISMIRQNGEHSNLPKCLLSNIWLLTSVL